MLDLNTGTHDPYIPNCISHQSGVCRFEKEPCFGLEVFFKIVCSGFLTLMNACFISSPICGTTYWVIFSNFFFTCRPPSIALAPFLASSKDTASSMTRYPACAAMLLNVVWQRDACVAGDGALGRGQIKPDPTRRWLLSESDSVED